MALSASGVGGEICTASAGRAGGGLSGGQGFGTDRPSSSQDLGGADQAPGEPVAPAGGGETAPAADAVLPGGGVAEPLAPGPEVSERETTEPPPGAPEEIARQEGAPLAEGEAEGPAAPAEQEPLAASPDTTPITANEEATAVLSPVPTAPEPTEPADTPTSKPAAAVPPTTAQAAAAAPSGDKGGWGCEIVPGGGGGLGPLAFVLVALLVVTRFRGISARTTGSLPRPSA